MKFKKEDLKNGIRGDGPLGKTISDEIVGTRRWSTDYYRIFEFQGKFYGTCYSKGSTECQDESPYEYDYEEIECVELVPQQKTITIYVEKKS